MVLLLLLLWTKYDILVTSCDDDDARRALPPARADPAPTRLVWGVTKVAPGKTTPDRRLDRATTAFILISFCFAVSSGPTNGVECVGRRRGLQEDILWPATRQSLPCT